MHRASAPWTKPCELELTAFAHTICDCAPASASAAAALPPLAVMFLLDASGSLSEMDFVAMKAGVKSLVTVLRQRLPHALVGLLQFTTESHMVMPLTSLLELPACLQQVDGMQRMSGGTNLEVRRVAWSRRGGWGFVVCLREVKEVRTAVCRQLPSACM